MTNLGPGGVKSFARKFTEMSQNLNSWQPGIRFHTHWYCTILPHWFVIMALSPGVIHFSLKELSWLVWRRQWHLISVLLPGKSHGGRSLEGCSPCGRWGSGTRLSDFTFTFHFHALEKEMATHSSVLAWRIPGMGEPSGLPSMGSHRVVHDWSDLAAAWLVYPNSTAGWPVANSREVPVTLKPTCMAPPGVAGAQRPSPVSTPEAALGCTCVPSPSVQYQNVDASLSAFSTTVSLVKFKIRL